MYIVFKYSKLSTIIFPLNFPSADIIVKNLSPSLSGTFFNEIIPPRQSIIGGKIYHWHTRPVQSSGHYKSYSYCLLVVTSFYGIIFLFLFSSLHGQCASSCKVTRLSDV